VGTDIVGEICIPQGVFSSDAVRKAVSAAAIFITYLLPLTTMIFCYSRVVYALKNKVTTTI